MSAGRTPFERSILEQIAINQSRSPTERFQALCDLLDAARALAPRGHEAEERRRRALAVRQREREQFRALIRSSLPNSGASLQRALEALVATLSERGAEYALIGDLAVIQHGRVRTTDDVDVLLNVQRIALPRLLETLQRRGFAVDIPAALREFADHGLATLRFGDVVVDLLKPVIPAYQRVLDRAEMREIGTQHVRVCSAEGLIVTKLIAMRPQDEADIQELLFAHAGNLDMEFIRAQLATCTTPDDPRWAKFERWAQDAGLA